MQRSKSLLVAAAALAGAFGLAAAQRPSVLAQAAPGMWEISGAPGAKAPLRQCIANLADLARFEHRAARPCSARVISESPSLAVIEYSCGAAGFGRSRVDLITPRSLRIETQGISGHLPFNYVLQARRTGDCPLAAAQRR
jgi:hypothetical protein